MGGQMLHSAASVGGSVAYSPLEERFLLLFLFAALIGGLILFWTRTMIKRVVNSFLRRRPAEASPRMPISAKSVVIEPTEDLSEGTSQYSTGLQSQPSSGLRHRNRAYHNLVERLGSEYQTSLQPWQGSTADTGEAEWQKYNLLSLGHPAYLSWSGPS